MGYDEKVDRMNWKDEMGWIVISVVSGVLLSVLFLYFDTFPELNSILLVVLCGIGFYVLSILMRVQNLRGKPIAGSERVKARYVKYIFPLVGFGIGAAIVFLN